MLTPLKCFWIYTNGIFSCIPYFLGSVSSNHELTHKNSKADDSSSENLQDMTVELRVCRQTYVLSVPQIFFF